MGGILCVIEAPQIVELVEKYGYKDKIVAYKSMQKILIKLYKNKIISRKFLDKNQIEKLGIKTDSKRALYYYKEGEK